MTPSSIDEALALSERMAANPADAVGMASQLADVLDRLPPEAATLLSRPAFQRATLWTLGVSFENVLPDGEAPPQTILCQHDVWIRAVVMQAIPKFVEDDQGSLVNLIRKLRLFREACTCQGTNGRFLTDVNWRVDARQGFISQGQAEILAPGTIVTGDGFYVAPLDWRLQKQQTIEVRLRSRMRDFLPDTIDPNIITDADRELRWVTVNFWAEELRQPSAR